MRMPRVSGRSDSALKYLMVWGLPSSNKSKLSLVRLGISAPCLSLTLKNNWTTSTLTLRVSADWSCDWALELGGGVWEFCPAAGSDRTTARARRPIAKYGLQCNVGISVLSRDFASLCCKKL